MDFDMDVAKRAARGSVMTFADSDWAGDADRRSNSGTATWVRGKLGWYPISATSRKQTTVALSSGEAEMVAALSGACEGLGINELWQWLVDFKSDFELSTGGVVKISPFEAHTGSKAPGNVAAFLERALVQVVKVGTSDMVADALTKVMSMPTDHGGLLGLRRQ